MPIGVNLLPWRSHRAAHKRRVFSLALCALGLLGLSLMWAASLAIDPARQHQADTNAKLRAQMTTLSARVSEYRQLEQHHQALTERTAALASINQQQADSLNALVAAIQALPPSIVLSALEQTPSAITLSATTQTPEALPSVLKRLREHSAFRTATLKTLQPGTQAQGDQHALTVSAQRKNVSP